MTSIQTHAMSETDVLEDRRAFPRRRARGAANWWRRGEWAGKGRPAKLADVSHGGVSLVIAEPAEPGEWLELEMIAPTGTKVFVRQAEVRWIAREPSGTFHIGCSWRSRMTFAEMQKFV